MGRGLQTGRGDVESRVVRRLTLSYLAVFVGVIAALSAVAFFLVDRNYRDVMEPALATPEGGAVFARFEQRAAGAILLIDAALVLLVGAASLGLARAAVRPLALARAREEHFAADVAHELRTPLAAIASIAQAARDDAPPAERAAFATIARRALDAGTLIADLLTLARSGGRDVLQVEPVDLAGVVAQVMGEAPAQGITVDVELHSAIVDGDARRLGQLVRNLLANALSHARSQVTLAVEPDSGWATLTVDDDGPGVPVEFASRLFERFAKGPESAGSGLGLAICRWVARSHGGDIAYAGGARFVVRLPLGEYPDADTESVVEGAPA